MRKHLASLICIGALASSSAAAESLPVSDSNRYYFELAEPSVRISLPNLPRISMEPHPLHEQQPHLRLIGSEEKIEVTIITPASEPGMTAIDCAGASATAILERYGIQSDQAFKGRADENTFLLIYGYPLEEFILLNAHILSASKDNYCIEVHVSKQSTSDADLEPWFNGFGESRIEEY